ncbi:lipoprotein [Streptomyces termitum]|uniref:lipoprotein n=1 Tax=Streptomyces termitum TaxID=67368 RepID=UPI0037B1D1A7
MPVRAPFLRTALLASVLLTACGTAPEPDAAPSAAPSSPATPSAPSAPAVRAAGAVGGAGSACPLPVSFSLAEKWEPKPVDPELAALVKRGPALLACEVAGRKSGDTAFLRVWKAPKGPARAALDAFVRTEKNKGLALTEAAGGVPVVEARYSAYSELLEEWYDGRAFAVGTGEGVVVVEVDGMDAEEDRVVAAYELAKSTLKAG